jgi:hypothetical protein
MSAKHVQVSATASPPGGLSGGSHFLYGGTLVTLTRRFVYNGKSTDAETASSYVAQTVGLAVQDQVLSKITWQSSGADNTTQLLIDVNSGATTYTITLSGYSGTMAIPPIPLFAGNYIQVSYAGGTAPNGTTVLLT